MQCSTEEGVVFDVNSLYAHFQILKDSRKPKGLRYELAVVLVMIMLAKICGQDTPSGIADWVKHRAEQFIEVLKLKRKSMPHHSTYRLKMIKKVLGIYFYASLSWVRVLRIPDGEQEWMNWCQMVPNVRKLNL